MVVVQKAISDRRRLLKETKEKRDAAKVEAHWMRKKKEVVEAKCKDLEREKKIK